MIMISPLDAIYIDDRDSYPFEECVAKMLGWMQGLERLHFIHMDEYGIPPDKLAHLPKLDYPIKVYLDQLKERAKLELEKAVEAMEIAEEGTAEKDILRNVVNEKELATKYGSELIVSEFFFRLELKKELAKGEASILKIDQSESKEKGVLHITLESLHEWAARYDVTIIDKPLFKINSSTEQQYLTNKESSDPVGSLSSVKADHLYTTFSFLLEAFADVKNSGYRRSDGELNVEAIATHLASLAYDSNNKCKLPGQSSEAIKDRIQHAIKIKASKLPK